MKLLGKIVSIVETDVFKRKDDTWGPIYSGRSTAKTTRRVSA